MTIGKVCGSGLKAVHLATQAIKCGDADVIIAGGQENMSASGHVLKGSRDGFRMGDAKLVDTMIVDGLWDVYNQYHMGTTAENIAKKYEVSRQEQDAFAAASQNKAEAAQKAGKFKDEITPVEIPSKKGSTVFDTDEFVKHGVTAESLGALRPAFSKEGSVTAGNTSGLNDGGSGRPDEGARPGTGLKRWRRSGLFSAGVDPKIMGMGPVPAANYASRSAGNTRRDLRDQRSFARAGDRVNKRWDGHARSAQRGENASPSAPHRRIGRASGHALIDGPPRCRSGTQLVCAGRDGRALAVERLNTRQRKKMAQRIAVITGAWVPGESISTKMQTPASGRRDILPGNKNAAAGWRLQGKGYTFAPTASMRRLRSCAMRAKAVGGPSTSSSTMPALRAT
jgi:hypothetical protein